MGWFKNLRKKAGKFITQVAPTALTIAGVASGNPALIAAGSALGSIGQSEAENSAIDAANAQARQQTDYQNQVITWQNEKARKEQEYQNSEIQRANESDTLTTAYENQKITTANTYARLNDLLKRRQVDEYNARGRQASRLEQESILGSLSEQQAALGERGEQEALQASQQRMQRIRQGLRERTSMVVQTAESGAVGRSLSRDAIANAIWQAEDTGTIDTNLEFTRSQLSRERRGLSTRAQSSLNKSVFYDEAQDIETPMVPLLPNAPKRKLYDPFVPQPLMDAPVEAPTLSSTDIALRAAGAGMTAFVSNQRPRSDAYRLANTEASYGPVGPTASQHRP